METLTLNNNRSVFGIEVKTFSQGIGEAFDELIKITDDCAGERNLWCEQHE